MPYEDPIEAALRSLTDVEWRKRNEGFETRVNKTHMLGIEQMLTQHHIEVHADGSAVRTGRYIVTVHATQTAAILKAVKATNAQVKPHRRKWRS
jgi:hypothetical protein